MSTTRKLPKPNTRLLSVWRIKEMVDSGEIVLDAPYQRDVVWETEKMSDLIDSMMNNYYIPPILFAVKREGNKVVRVVIDGKQRLTSTTRFMKNMIPYKDSTSDFAMETYYSEDVEGGENQEDREYFLSAEEFEDFNRFEFVCVEYSGITEDDEFKIFSRVQMGKAITRAERLKANNTPRANLCREYMERYSSISTLLKNTTRADLFQTITQILYTIQIDDPTRFNASSIALSKFVQDQDPVAAEYRDKLVKVLNIWKEFATSNNLKLLVTSFNDRRRRLLTLEILVFSKFVSCVQRARSAPMFAEDFKNMRIYLRDKRGGNTHVGKQAMVHGYAWVDDYLDQHNLRAVRRAQASHAYHMDFDDDIKPDDEEQRTALPPNMRGLHVARRGGKLPSKIRKI